MKRVTQIAVTDLFGVFNHTIPLNAEDHITIIHGPNGFGKTAILRLVDGLVNSRFATLRRTPFADFQLRFDDGSDIKVERTTGDVQPSHEKKPGSATLQFTLSKPGAKPLTYTSKASRESESVSRYPLSALDELVPVLTRTGAREWTYLPTGETFFGVEDLLDRFDVQLEPIANRFRDSSPIPNWLKELGYHVHLIETQRLLRTSAPRLSRPVDPYARSYRLAEARRNMEPAVTAYSQELRDLIQATLAESTKIAQRLDRTFPARVFRQDDTQYGLTMEGLRQRLSQLEERRSSLMAAGLLDTDNDTEFQPPEEIDDPMVKKLLAVYVQDVEQKLGVLEDLARKIDTLTAIITHRFLYKTMKIDPSKGYYFVASEGNNSGKVLLPTDLSSGEQNELILIYELLFRVSPGSLIMIDEPEISLHVAWQEEFLRDLQQVIQLNDLDILIATHSPQIVYDRWDLTVDLAGQEAEA